MSFEFHILEGEVMVLKHPIGFIHCKLGICKLLLTNRGCNQCFIPSVKYVLFQEEGSTSAREWTDKMQSQDRCVLICEFIIREKY